MLCSIDPRGAVYPPIRRFSSTVSGRKIFRPSGTSTMPRRTTLCAAVPVMSRPSNRTDPESGLWNPAIARRLVVFPAPFAPSTSVTRPADADNDPPCSARTGPELTCRSLTSSTRRRPLPHAALPDGGMPHHIVRIALGDELADVHREQVVAGVDHHFHVVLDDELGDSLVAQLPHQLADLLALGGVHARGGFVEQQQPRAADD